MSTYKRLNKQDAYITTYTARKSWAVTGSDFISYGITTHTATGSYLNSLQQLYYPNKQSGEIISHSYDYYNQTTLAFSSSRNLTTGSIIYSIPRDLFGTHLQPGVGLTAGLSGLQQTLYVESLYWSSSYVDEITAIGTVDAITFADDGEGNLFVVGSSPRRYIGDAIYSHGMLIITDQEYLDLLQSKPIDFITFQSNQPIYTHNYHCKAKESDYNFTQNPSAISSSLKATYDSSGDLYSASISVSDGYIKANLTGSEFQPYITTVGLYNDANQLIAVGKLSQPVPKSGNTDMTFVVKIDI
jgi:hypothetical protein